jgi:hypothetical protein
VSLPPPDNSDDAQLTITEMHVKSISSRRIPLKRESLLGLTGAHVFRVKYLKEYKDQFVYSPPPGTCECTSELGAPELSTNKVQMH